MDAKIIDPESADLEKSSLPKFRFKKIFNVSIIVLLGFGISGLIFTAIYFFAHHLTGYSDLTESFSCRYYQEQTYLWKVDTVPPSYIFGTIPSHPDLVWDAVSKQAKNAFTQSDEVFTELTEDEKESARYYLNDGRTIVKDELPEVVSRKLTNFLNDKSVELTGSYREAWNRFSERIQTSKPYQVALDLMSVKSPEEPPESLTSHLESLASYQGKSVRSLETPSEHYDTLEKMPDDTVLKLIKDAMERLQNPNPERNSLWRSKGDILSAYICAKDSDLQSDQIEVVKYVYDDETFQDYDDYWSSDFPDLNKNKYPFNIKNQNLARRIGYFLKQEDGKSKFFAVGVDTLLGYNSVIHLLWREGFKIERVKSTLRESIQNFFEI